MKSREIVVLGGGFAGLWSAVGAARKLDELGIGSDEIRVTLINRDAFHSIRVRNYEADLSSVRVPLDEVLGPAGVRRIEAEVCELDLSRQTIALRSRAGDKSLAYDRLVFALGSRLARPNLPGLAEYAFDVDTYGSAKKLAAHLSALPDRADSPGQFTVLVVGAGLTGLETATEMPARLREIATKQVGNHPERVILADHQPHVGSDMGDSARPVIEAALAAVGVETRLGIQVVAIDEHGVTLDDDSRIDADTVIWCAGMKANPLTSLVPVERDHSGRLPVDEFLRVKGVAHVFAAGDSAWLPIDGTRPSVMSCQHSRPMGRFAGHNVVCDLLDLPMLPLQIDWYVTVLDLGPWGAVYTEGWDRHVVATDDAAKKTKQEINRRRIYPPLGGDRAAILAAAAPVVQPPPNYDTTGGAIFH